MQLDLSDTHLAIVRSILRKHAPQHSAWAFGSRVQGTAQRFSDLDICVDGSQSMGYEETANLKLAFSESNLPFVVDVVDLKRCSAAFASEIATSRSALV
jgi:uncharacterized protein